MTAAATYRVGLTLDQTGAERAATLLGEVWQPPADAVALFDAGDGHWRVDAYFAAPPDAAALGRFLEERDITAQLEISAVPDADWVTISQERLHPVRAGRFLVHGRHDRARIPPSRWAIEIDAAQAFGTAHHGSTRGCLLALDRLAKTRAVSCVLDLGTGSGVLAIAAARSWRAPVIASDIDPVATGIARTHARRNGVARLVTSVTAPGLRHPLIRARAPFDLVVANILARPLTALAPALARAIRPGGSLVLSGITGDQARRVAAAFRSAGFQSQRRLAVAGWVTLLLVRGSGPP